MSSICTFCMVGSPSFRKPSPFRSFHAKDGSDWIALDDHDHEASRLLAFNVHIDNSPGGLNVDIRKLLGFGFGKNT